MDLKQTAERIFMSGVAAVDPSAAIKKLVTRDRDRLRVAGREYDLATFDRVFVVGTGKAGASMSAAVEDLLGDRITEGAVNVKYEHTCALKTIALAEAGHPVPDAAGEAGARKILELLGGTTERDLVVCLISGGGSAIMPLPADGLTLADKQETTAQLLACGASIDEINAIRKHISAVKGGRLAQAAHPARLITLMLSDVIGDPLDVIASGPTVPDESTYEQCLDVLRRYGIEEQIPTPVRERLAAGAAGKLPETPKPDDPAFRAAQNVVVGSNIIAVRAAAEEARALGFNTMVLSSFVAGETKEVARVHAAIAREICSSGNPLGRPACVISGGETTVTIRGSGLGGRSQEFALAAAIDLDGTERVGMLCAGTDGTDGPTDAAGAYANGTTAARARSLGLSPWAYLQNNDSYHFFEKLGDLLKTGPTRTNVMDLRIVLVE